MVNDAEKYKQEDEEAASRIAAKNGLESYAYNLRNSLQDEKLKDKFEAEDKEKLEKAVSEVTEWVEHNAEASKDEYESRQKELEEVANPIMMKIYGSGGMPGQGGMPDMSGMGGGMPGGMPGQAPPNDGGNGPTIEEVD